jgi:serine protease AprX
MRSNNYFRLTAWLTFLSLAVGLCGGIVLADKANAQTPGSAKSKGSADLRAKAHSLTSTDTVKIIIQLRGPMSSALSSLLNSNGVHLKQSFNGLGAHIVEMPASAFDTLAAFDEVGYMSYDRPVQSMGHLSVTTGADTLRTTNGANVSGLDGTGIGIAVLDSGIYRDHTDFLNRGNTVRVVYSQDFTGENRTDDPYGHGTHVAAIAGGGGRVSNGAYLGIAPNANLVNLRVLNSQGTGTVANTLAALDWVLSNRAAYNIRVVNMSLGTPAIDSYKNDPLCRAVRRLVDAGIVVVVAAGNNGKNAAGQKTYGMIHCPGNEPSALTVGAANTFGTDARNDDGVATYSSRGPTRSYWTDSYSLKHYDHLMKPDLVAPGNKIIEAQAVNNLLVTQNPQLAANVSPVAARDQMYLSGTSMASPAVAGAAALILQANPTLTPNLVKVILMYTAQPLAGFNTLEQGAGELNIEGAVRLARLVRTDFGASKPVGAPLLTTPVLPIPQTTIAGYTFKWSQGILLGQHWAKGTSLITKYQPVYALGTIVSDGTVVSDGTIISDGVTISDGVIITDGTIVTDGVIITDGTVVSDGVIASDGTVVSDKIIIDSGVTISDGILALRLGTIVSDGVIITDGTVVSDGVIASDGTIVSDGTVVSDAYLQAQAAMVSGDPAKVLNIALDNGTDCLSY